jgi:hypothetical protein
MTIGQLNASHRLGIANLRSPNAQNFLSAVLGINSVAPKYQQGISRNTFNETTAGYRAQLHTDWGCGSADGTSSNATVVREISPCDHYFGRQNMTNAQVLGQTPAMYFNLHRTQNSNQIYYLMNEPDLGAYRLLSPANSCGSAGAPFKLARRGDQFETSYFAAGYAFWEADASAFLADFVGGDTAQPILRPKAVSLAAIYKQIALSAGNGNVVVMPSATDPFHASYTRGYYNAFFSSVHSAGTYPALTCKSHNSI